jgi:hypothetical protein
VILKGKYYLTDLSDAVVNTASHYFYHLTHRSPVIVPLIMVKGN